MVDNIIMHDISLSYYPTLACAVNNMSCDYYIPYGVHTRFHVNNHHLDVSCFKRIKWDIGISILLYSIGLMQIFT